MWELNISTDLFSAWRCLKQVNLIEFESKLWFHKDQILVGPVETGAEHPPDG